MKLKIHWTKMLQEVMKIDLTNINLICFLVFPN